MALFFKRANQRNEVETRESKRRKIIAALMAGRHLSVYNGKEFKCSEMHTEFCKIRRKIADRKITGFVMCDVWRTNKDGVRYKEYWFERENG